MVSNVAQRPVGLTTDPFAEAVQRAGSARSRPRSIDAMEASQEIPASTDARRMIGRYTDGTWKP